MSVKNLRIGWQYRIDRKIGDGSHGEIYTGNNLISGEEVAIRLEDISTESPRLGDEIEVYQSLAGGDGIPSIHWEGFAWNYRVLVMDSLGPSLEDLFNFCNRKFSLVTLLRLADQLITRMKYIHDKGFVHRDLQPENFMMGTWKRSSQVHITDFGLATRYRDPETGGQIPDGGPEHITGTLRHGSFSSHRGAELSRRADMESLGYILLYFYCGSLPWSQPMWVDRGKRMEDIVIDMKKDLSQHLDPGVPREFLLYLEYTRSLEFTQTPDYTCLRAIFHLLFVRKEVLNSNIFDWHVLKRNRDLRAKRERDLLAKRERKLQAIKEDCKERKSIRATEEEAKELPEQIYDCSVEIIALNSLLD
ncbi:serine/threonine protein kinase [Aspergillus nanangensis]|uniref:Serine/threonine protein kinase n=1 Tax=Aspergillus nanangensis TaxID=2582783 RepID=A0AAD4CKL9_ASPNN|nr:serine/threonine protein kinase [Aspergillus nanangensis]